MNSYEIPEQPPPKYDESSLAESHESKNPEEVIVIEEAPRLSRNERAIREQIQISGVSDQRREEAPLHRLGHGLGTATNCNDLGSCLCNILLQNIGNLIFSFILVIMFIIKANTISSTHT